jgi:hypothetical protein
MKALIIIALALTGTCANADSWKGRDKDAHAIVGATIGSAVTMATGNHWHGCAAATAVGFAKEVYDSQHKTTHTASFKDFAVTAAAGCLSSKATSIFIAHNKIVVSWSF